MNAFVTGATGFIGWHLASLLRRHGHQVICLVRDMSRVEALDGLDVEYVVGDLASPGWWDAVLAEIDVVFHVAGTTRVSRASEYYRGNQEATHRLLAACRKHSGRLNRFVYISSQAAAGPSWNGKMLDEESPCIPVSDYGRSKLLGELEVLRVRNELPVTILRPSVVYGPRERDLFQYVRGARLGVMTVAGSGRKMVNVVHVDDCVRALALAAEHPSAVGQTYFVGSDASYSMKEVCETIAATVGTRPLMLTVPDPLVHLVGTVGSMFGAIARRRVFMNREKAKELTAPGWECSVDKIRRQLGFRPSLSLSEGIAGTYRWYCEHGWIRDAGKSRQADAAVFGTSRR